MRPGVSRQAAPNRVSELQSFLAFRVSWHRQSSRRWRGHLRRGRPAAAGDRPLNKSGPSPHRAQPWLTTLLCPRAHYRQRLSPTPLVPPLCPPLPLFDSESISIRGSCATLALPPLEAARDTTVRLRAARQAARAPPHPRPLPQLPTPRRQPGPSAHCRRECPSPPPFLMHHAPRRAHAWLRQQPEQHGLEPRQVVPTSKHVLSTVAQGDGSRGGAAKPEPCKYWEVDGQMMAVYCEVISFPARSRLSSQVHVGHTSRPSAASALLRPPPLGQLASTFGLLLHPSI